MNIPIDINLDFNSLKSNSSSLLNSKGNNNTSCSSFESLLSNILNSNSDNKSNIDINYEDLNLIDNENCSTKDSELLNELISKIENILSSNKKDNAINDELINIDKGNTDIDVDIDKDTININNNTDEDSKLNEDISFLQSITPLLLYNYNDMTNTQENYSDKIAEILSEFSNTLNQDQISDLKNVIEDFVKTSNLEFSLEDSLKITTSDNLVDTNTLDINDLDLTPSNDKAVNSDMTLNPDTNIISEVGNNEGFDLFNKSEDNQNKLLNELDVLKQNINKSNRKEDFDINGFYNSFKTDNKKINEVDIENIDIKSIDTIDAINLLNNINQQSVNNDTLDISNSISNNFILKQESLSEDLFNTISNMKNTDLKQLRLKLTPKELGEMTIDISQIDTLSKITLTVSNQDTLNLIKGNLREILEHLRQNDLISSNASITVNNGDSNKESFSSFSQSYSDDKNKKSNKDLSISNISKLDLSDDRTNNTIESNSDSLNILA